MKTVSWSARTFAAAVLVFVAPCAAIAAERQETFSQTFYDFPWHVTLTVPDAAPSTLTITNVAVSGVFGRRCLDNYVQDGNDRKLYLQVTVERGLPGSIKTLFNVELHGFSVGRDARAGDNNLHVVSDGFPDPTARVERDTGPISVKVQPGDRVFVGLPNGGSSVQKDKPLTVRISGIRNWISADAPAVAPAGLFEDTPGTCV